MIQFHNPEAETAVEDELYKLSYDIGENEGENITVALLANGCLLYTSPSPRD